MAQIDSNLSTGLPGFDQMIKGLIPGDNLVWRVDNANPLKQRVICDVADRQTAVEALS